MKHLILSCLISKTEKRECNGTNVYTYGTRRSKERQKIYPCGTYVPADLKGSMESLGETDRLRDLGKRINRDGKAVNVQTELCHSKV
jgi:hypothetical protein